MALEQVAPAVAFVSQNGSSTLGELFAAAFGALLGAGAATRFAEVNERRRQTVALLMRVNAFGRYCGHICADLVQYRSLLATFLSEYDRFKREHCTQIVPRLERTAIGLPRFDRLPEFALQVDRLSEMALPETFIHASTASLATSLWKEQHEMVELHARLAQLGRRLEELWSAADYEQYRRLFFRAPEYPHDPNSLGEIYAKLDFLVETMIGKTERCALDAGRISRVIKSNLGRHAPMVTLPDFTELRATGRMPAPYPDLDINISEVKRKTEQPKMFFLF